MALGPHDDTPRFEPGPKGGEPPMVIGGHVRPDDPLEILPKGEPHRRWIGLTQRADDAYGQTISFEVEREASLTAQAHSRRLDELIRPRNEGGHGLDDGSHLVTVEREKLERAQAEHARIKALRAQRAAKWNAVGQLRRLVSDWVLRDLPGGVALEVVEPEAPSKLITKGETLLEATQRYRAEIAARTEKLRQVESARWPLAAALTRADALIDKLAAEGAPRFEGMIRHGGDLSFTKNNLQAQLHNVQPRPDGAPTIGFVETENVLGLVAWVFGPELKAKIREELGKLADDKRALTLEQREARAADIKAEILALERKACCLVFAADERGEILDLWPDVSPQALLCVTLRTLTPAEMPSGTSREHAINITGTR